MKNDSSHEALAKLVSKPCNVARRELAWGAVRLDFHADDSLCPELRDHVDLSSTLLLAQVIESRPSLRDGKLPTQLRDDKGLHDTPEEIAVAQHGILVEAQNAREQGRIDQVAFGGRYEAFETVGAPGRNCFYDRQVGQQSLIGERRLAVDSGRVIQCPVSDEACGASASP